MTGDLRTARRLLAVALLVGVGGIAAALTDGDGSGGDGDDTATEADSTSSTRATSTSATATSVTIDPAAAGSTTTTSASGAATSTTAPTAATTSPPVTEPPPPVTEPPPPVTEPPPPVTEPPVTVPPVTIPPGAATVVIQNDMAVPLDVSVNGGFLRIGGGGRFEGPALAEVDDSGVDLITVSHPQELGPPDAGCGSHQLAQLLEPGGRHLIRIRASGTCQLLGGSPKPSFTVTRQ